MVKKTCLLSLILFCLFPFPVFAQEEVLEGKIVDILKEKQQEEQPYQNLEILVTNPLPFGQVINNEIIAEEIIRTLVASIGLITAVPITTFLAVNFRKE